MRTARRFKVSSGGYTLPSILILMGGIVAVYGLFVSPERTWMNLLLNGFYLMSLAVSATFFMASQRLASSRWAASLRRIPEAFMMGLPVAAGLMLLVFFGGRAIYPWSHPGAFDHAPAIAGKAVYLKVPFVLARVVGSLVLWAIFAWLFRRTSLAQDKDRNKSLVYHHRLTRYSAIFAVVFAPSFTLSAYDWIISLEPEWFSTMFAVYVFAGAFVQGLSAITLAVVLLKERGYLGGAVDEHQLHDLGKMLFAFATFWAYIWVCQYLLIWYGNMPEEVPYYVTRTQGHWLFVFVLNLIVNWVAPFVILLSARAKRNTRVLKAVSLLLLFGHWLDLYLLIMPSKWAAPKMGLFEVPIAVGYMALAYLVFVRSLAKAPLVPVNDPIVVAENLSRAHAHP